MHQDFISKPNSHYNNSFTGTYEKPRICPHCGNGNDSTAVQRTVLNMGQKAQALVETCKCTLCDRYYLFANYRDSSNGNGNAVSAFVYPSRIDNYENKNFSSFSERFVKMYNQALHAEDAGDFELAAIGYRSALEYLVKDYAISELHIPVESVAKKSLFEAIGEYLGSKELVSTADVVRILGNDYTHYDRKYPDLNFDLLKKYMSIFMDLVETKYLINHPPVGRSD